MATDVSLLRRPVDGTNAPDDTRGAGVNVGQNERVASLLGGGALAVYGITRGSVGGALLALAGGSLVYRGATGHCSLYEAMGVNTADVGSDGDTTGHVGQLGIKVERAILVNRPASELFAFWRNFENLARFMKHVESVKVLDDKVSHWVVKPPIGPRVEWDASIINEVPDELIAWKSVEGADVESAGSVRFSRGAAGRGTLVRVELQYDPPGGSVGAFVAKLFGEAPEKLIEGDLKRFKSVMETGEVATTEGQPSGRDRASR